MHTLTCINHCGLDRFLLKKLLSANGLPFDVNSTDTGNQLINLLLNTEANKNQLPGSILLDMDIPGFDAWDFMDNLNWLYPALAKPVDVYIISAPRYAVDIKRSKQYAFVKAVILKPITKEVIQKLIQQKANPYSQFAMLGACC